jgi:hypothetical protein
MMDEHSMGIFLYRAGFYIISEPAPKRGTVDEIHLL